MSSGVANLKKNIRFGVHTCFYIRVAKVVRSNITTPVIAQLKGVIWLSWRNYMTKERSGDSKKFISWVSKKQHNGRPFDWRNGSSSIIERNSLGLDVPLELYNIFSYFNRYFICLQYAQEKLPSNKPCKKAWNNPYNIVLKTYSLRRKHAIPLLYHISTLM